MVPGANLLGGPGGLGVDLMQLIVAPSLAFKFTPDHSVGVAPLLGYQRFKANGLAAFGGASSDPAALTNNGYDYSYGYGIRVGYFGKLTPTVSVGAAYATKMNFGEFDKYAGLFAEQGDLDIPSNWTLGAAWQTTPELKLALDYQRINYSGVKSVGNAAANSLVGPNGLGTDGGSGFGWDDVNVWKLGAEYQYSPSLTLRGGLSHANQPIDGAAFGEVMFNILAPGVIKNHMTLGFTYTLASGDELSMAYMHGFKNDVSGADPFFGGTDTLRMYQNSLGAQYSWKF